MLRITMVCRQAANAWFFGELYEKTMDGRRYRADGRLC